MTLNCQNASAYLLSNIMLLFAVLAGTSNSSVSLHASQLCRSGFTYLDLYTHIRNGRLPPESIGTTRNPH
jgi:hypothetical protein